MHYHFRGLSLRDIAEKTGTSKDTVSRILRSKEAMAEKKRAGRSHKISEKYSKALIREFEAGKLKTCSDGQKYILEAIGVNVGREAIRRILLNSGLKNYVGPKKPRLLPKHRLVRYRFCKNSLLAPENFWNHVMFTDESKFNLYAPDGYHSVWRRPGSHSLDHHFRQTVKFGGGV